MSYFLPIMHHMLTVENLEARKSIKSASLGRDSAINILVCSCFLFHVYVETDVFNQNWSLEFQNEEKKVFQQEGTGDWLAP